MLPENHMEGRGAAACEPQALCPPPPPDTGAQAPRPRLPAGPAGDSASAHMATLPLASLPRSNTAVPGASWAPPAEAWLARMYPLAELAEEVTTLSMVTGGACCTTWIAWPEGCCAVTMDAGM